MHEYLRRLELALSKGLVDRPTFYQAVVLHDEDCALLAKGRECRCDPEIYVDARNSRGVLVRTHVLKDGSLSVAKVM